MTTTPTGDPYWVRSSGVADFGGHASKRNYNDQPVINPQTDVGAEHIQRLSADMVAAVRMMPFCKMTVQMASGTTAPTVLACRLGTAVYQGAGYAGDSPPTGFPEVLGVSDGICTIEFDTSYSDEFGVAGDYAPAFPFVSAFEPSTLPLVRAHISGQVVTVSLYDGTTTPPTLDTGQTFSLEVS